MFRDVLWRGGRSSSLRWNLWAPVRTASSKPHVATTSTSVIEDDRLGDDDRFTFSGPRGDKALYGLIAANVAVYGLWQLPSLHEFMTVNFITSGAHLQAGLVHTLVTSAFSHHSLLHLGANMLSLHSIGSILVSRHVPDQFALTSSEVLKLYLAAGVAGSLGHIFLSSGGALGASAVVCAVVVTTARWLPELELSVLFFPVSITRAVQGLGAINVGLIALEMLGVGVGVSGAGHLGGMGIGALVAATRMRELGPAGRERYRGAGWSIASKIFGRRK